MTINIITVSCCCYVLYCMVPSSSSFLFKILTQMQCKKVKNKDLCTQKRMKTRFSCTHEYRKLSPEKSLQNEFMTSDSSCDVTFLSILKIQNGLYPRFILSSLFWHTCVMCVAMCLLTKRAKNLLFSADLFLFTFKSSYHDDIMLS